MTNSNDPAAALRSFLDRPEVETSWVSGFPVLTASADLVRGLDSALVGALHRELAQLVATFGPLGRVTRIDHATGVTLEVSHDGDASAGWVAVEVPPVGGAE